jgi:hypothetical protein
VEEEVALLVLREPLGKVTPEDWATEGASRSEEEAAAVGTLPGLLEQVAATAERVSLRLLLALALLTQVAAEEEPTPLRRPEQVERGGAATADKAPAGPRPLTPVATELRTLAAERVLVVRRRATVGLVGMAGTAALASSSSVTRYRPSPSVTLTTKEVRDERPSNT